MAGQRQAGRHDTDSDTECFFRAFDGALLDHYSRPSGSPLLLAALPEYHHLIVSGTCSAPSKIGKDWV
jgi:hypothetical protein